MRRFFKKFDKFIDNIVNDNNDISTCRNVEHSSHGHIDQREYDSPVVLQEIWRLNHIDESLFLVNDREEDCSIIYPIDFTVNQYESYIAARKFGYSNTSISLLFTTTTSTILTIPVLDIYSH